MTKPALGTSNKELVVTTRVPLRELGTAGETAILLPKWSNCNHEALTSRTPDGNHQDHEAEANTSQDARLERTDATPQSSTGV
jgi:hypothetical protein